MAFKIGILGPEEAKKRAIVKVKEWERQKEMDTKKAKPESGKPKPFLTVPATEPISRIDWSKLDLNQIETLVTSRKGVPAWEAIEQANKEGKIIIPNCVHDRILNETNHWENLEIKESCPVWTGTCVVYEAPDTPFGKEVVFKWAGWRINDEKYYVSFSIPKQFQGKENCILVVEHPDFIFEQIEQNKFELIVKNENFISLVEIFPRKGQWCNYEKIFRIPVGEPPHYSEETTRYLYRLNGSYVGLLVRDCNFNGFSPNNVIANRELPARLGVRVINSSVLAAQL